MPKARGNDRGSTLALPRSQSVDILIVAFLACIAGLGNDFANDDIALIAQNTRIHDFARWRDWFMLPYWPPPYSPDLYRPVTTTLLALEHMLGGGSPIMFRLVSYAMYAAVCVGVYLLASRRLGTAIATAMAILFAAHPVHVEATALAVGQSELLSALLTIAMTVIYVDRRRTNRFGTRECVLLSVMYLVATLTKEQALLIPALLIAAEFLLVEKSRADHVKALGGIACIAAAALLVFVIRSNVLGEIAGSFQAEALDGVGWRGRALTMLAIVPQWVRLLLWPAHLRADYSPGEIVASTTFGAAEALGLTILVTAVIAAWVLRRRVPLFTFAMLWCAITLFPVSNLVVVTGIVLAERTLFLPSVGVVLAIGALYELLVVHKAIPLRVAIGAFMLLALLGVGRSMERQRVWRNDAFLVARTVSDAPRSFRNQRAFGDLMFELDQPKLAHEAYALALRHAPARTVWRIHNSYARALVRRGEHAPAAEQFRRSLQLRPDQDYERAELVSTYLTLGRYVDASMEADSGLTRSARPEVYRALKAVADSARRVNAPAGSVRVGLVRGDTRADR
jgi:protein O-mannosyl-transferase